ncbi:MAG: RNA polymerase sigma factor [Chitinophagaceae bacterium]|nr:MAG: RNA polymerase sigma factor [Chitinophagaceae bacterium]
MSLDDFNRKILTVKDKLYRFALKFIKDKQDAEDIVQDVLIKIWKQQNLVQDLLNFDAWCMKLVRNQSLDRLKSSHYKSSHLKIDPETESMGHSPYQHTESNNRMSIIRQLIQSLPDKQQEVLHLRDVEGFSYQEIADITEMEMNMIKVYLFRARNTIRTKLLNIEAYGTR